MISLDAIRTVSVGFDGLGNDVKVYDFNVIGHGMISGVVSLTPIVGSPGRVLMMMYDPDKAVMFRMTVERSELTDAMAGLIQESDIEGA